MSCSFFSPDTPVSIEKSIEIYFIVCVFLYSPNSGAWWWGVSYHRVHLLNRVIIIVKPSPRNKQANYKQTQCVIWSKIGAFKQCTTHVGFSTQSDSKQTCWNLKWYMTFCTQRRLSTHIWLLCCTAVAHRETFTSGSFTPFYRCWSCQIWALQLIFASEWRNATPSCSPFLSVTHRVIYFIKVTYCSFKVL